MKCDLGFCGECLNSIIPDEELDYGPNAPFIYFSVYNYVKKMMTRRMVLSSKGQQMEERKILKKCHVLLVNSTWYIISHC